MEKIKHLSVRIPSTSYRFLQDLSNLYGFSQADATRRILDCIEELYLHGINILDESVKNNIKENYRS